MKGWVYVITTETHNLVKIGYTDRDPDTRAAELNDTSSPHPHVVQYAALVHNPRGLESVVHRLLAEHRVNKEWFNTTVLEAADAIKSNADPHILFEEFSEAMEIELKNNEKALGNSPKHQEMATLEAKQYLQEAHQRRPKIETNHQADKEKREIWWDLYRKEKLSRKRK